MRPLAGMSIPRILGTSPGLAAARAMDAQLQAMRPLAGMSIPRILGTSPGLAAARAMDAQLQAMRSLDMFAVLAGYTTAPDAVLEIRLDPAVLASPVPSRERLDLGMWISQWTRSIGPWYSSLSPLERLALQGTFATIIAQADPSSQYVIWLILLLIGWWSRQ
jgi:hypothetical protein